MNLYKLFDKAKVVLDKTKKVVSVFLALYPIIKPILQANGIPAPDLGNLEQLGQVTGIATLAQSKPLVQKKPKQPTYLWQGD